MRTFTDATLTALRDKGISIPTIKGSVDLNLTPDIPEEEIAHITIAVSAYDENTDDEIELASMLIDAINTDIITEADGRLYMSDISADYDALASDLWFTNKNTKMKKKIKDSTFIFYVSDLFVKSEYRNLGIGGLLLDNLPEFLEACYAYPEFITLLLPTEREGSGRDPVAKLKSFYSKHGFRTMPNSTSETMYCFPEV